MNRSPVVVDRPDAGAPVMAAWIRRLVWLWDEAFVVPGLGWRVGLDPLIGLVPGVGDLIGFVVGALVVVEAGRLGAGPAVLGRMLLNLGIDAAVGAVPLIGDLADIGWKANRRNRALLERWLASPASARRASALVIAAVVLVLGALIGLFGWLVVEGAGALLRVT